MAKQTPNVYLAIKYVAQSYEERKRSYLKRKEAGEITRDQEYALTERLNHELKYELDRLIAKIDDGVLDGLDGEVEADTGPENAEVAVNG